MTTTRTELPSRRVFARNPQRFGRSATSGTMAMPLPAQLAVLAFDDEGHATETSRAQAETEEVCGPWLSLAIYGGSILPVVSAR